MTYAYDESYLNDVQKNLGFFFQLLLWNMHFSAQEVQSVFLASEIPEQIQIGNPDFLCGKSGFELAMLVFKESDFSMTIAHAVAEPFYPQAEYWCGYVLAYCQWKNNIPFTKILAGFPLERILDSYTLLHEANISKVEQIIMQTLA